MDMASRLRLMAWQIDIIEYERIANNTTDDDRPQGRVAKWEGDRSAEQMGTRAQRPTRAALTAQRTPDSRYFALSRSSAGEFSVVVTVVAQLRPANM